MTIREITNRERRMIGFVLGEWKVVSGHPLTCNGGNPDFFSHHAYEVKMLIEVEGDGPEAIMAIERGDVATVNLHCPVCGRVQPVVRWQQ